MSRYPDQINPDLLDLIPRHARVVLDVGCGTGALGAAYRARNPTAHLLGIEQDPNAAALARQRLDVVIETDVEDDPLPFNVTIGLDCIIYGDLLQDLRDPWAVVRRQLPALRPDGTVLVCIPNVEHWSLVARLFRGGWDYEQSGLLDATHLRWFSLDSVIRGLRACGLDVQEVRPRIFAPERVEEFARILAPALHTLRIDPDAYARRAAPLQYVLRGRLLTAAPFAITTRSEAVDDQAVSVAPNQVQPIPRPITDGDRTAVRPELDSEPPLDQSPGAFPLAGQPSTAKPTVTAQNPGFTVSYPDIVNADLIPPPALQLMEAAWKRGTFEPRPLNIYEFADGYVAHEAMVFDSNLRVLSSSTFASSNQDIADSVMALRDALRSGRFASRSNPTVVVRARNPFNYGHYLFDMFPRALVAQQLLPDLPLDFLVHRSSPRMLEIIYQSLSLIGIGSDRIITTGNEPTHLRNLVALEGLTRHGGYMSPLVIQALAAMASSVVPGPFRRLFVSRATARSRKLLNEDAVSAAMAAAGYTVVDTGELSLRDQIALFSGAERVVGVLGAAMSNIAFCRPGTKVAVLAPCSYPDTFFWFIANHKKLHYVEIRCQQQQSDGPQSWLSGFVVREPEIEFLRSF